MKFLAVTFFLLFLSFSLKATDFSYEYKGVELKYTIIDEINKTCRTKEGYYYYESIPGNYVNSSRLEIPSFAIYNGMEYKVVEIGTMGFPNLESLTTVIIPNTVTSIGDRAFECCFYITTIDLPQSVTSIGIAAFNSCLSLRSINIPPTLTSIPKDCFIVCSSLETLEIPNSVTFIDDRAFLCCKSLTTIDIPSSVSYIGDNVFGKCEALLSINVSEDNKHFSSIQGVLYDKIKASLIAVPGGIPNLDIPPTVTTICDNAGYFNNALTSLTIPDSVTRIGDWAFCGSEKLATLFLPGSIESIGMNAFSGCERLIAVYYNTGEHPFEDEQWSYFINIHPNAVLFVPEESVDICKHIAPWMYFNTILPYDFSGIDEIKDMETDDEDTQIYNLNGVRQTIEDIKQSHGIFLLRKGNRTKKILL